MKRRTFIAGLGSAAVWPAVARAQQPVTPVVGLLETSSPEPVSHLLTAFRRGLGEIGYVEGRNVAIEYRFAEGQGDRLPALAAELVQRAVSVIVTPGNGASALAAKAITATIPIVFSAGADPVQVGLVTSLNRPGGNVTGITFIAGELVPKRFGLLRELLPKASSLGVLVDPRVVFAPSMVADVRAAVQGTGLQVDFLHAGDVAEIDAAFVEFSKKRTQALLISPSALFLTRRVQLATLAARFGIPAISPQREYAQAGGLMSYGGSYTEEYRLVGTYTGRILAGEKPAEMPVTRPSKFEFIINLQTARALGLEIPATLLALADEVIE
jgi:putative ABC transport system substrate-binding protein